MSDIIAALVLGSYLAIYKYFPNKIIKKNSLKVEPIKCSGETDTTKDFYDKRGVDIKH